MIIKLYKDFRYRFSDTLAPSFDGREEWPTELVRANGFDAGFTGIPRPITAFPVTISCNGEAVDGGAAFDWYLSQRTDDWTNQYITVIQPGPLQSGTIELSLTGRALADLSLLTHTSQVSEEHLVRILTDNMLYVKRISDGAIQMVDLLRATLQ